MPVILTPEDRIELIAHEQARIYAQYLDWLRRGKRQAEWMAAIGWVIALTCLMSMASGRWL